MRLSTQPGTQPFRGSSYTDHGWWQPSQESRGIAKGKEQSETTALNSPFTEKKKVEVSKKNHPLEEEEGSCWEWWRTHHIQTVLATRESHWPLGRWCVWDGTELAKADYMTSALFKKNAEPLLIHRAQKIIWVATSQFLQRWCITQLLKMFMRKLSFTVGVLILTNFPVKSQSILRFAGFTYPCAFCPN